MHFGIHLTRIAPTMEDRMFEFQWVQSCFLSSPNGDGIAALEMLNIIEQFNPRCLRSA